MWCIFVSSNFAYDKSKRCLTWSLPLGILHILLNLFTGPFFSYSLFQQKSQSTSYILDSTQILSPESANRSLWSFHSSEFSTHTILLQHRHRRT